MSVVVVCSAFTAYTSLCRCLKYLIEISYFIQEYPKVVGFSIFKTLLGQVETLPYVWKKYYKNERHFCLVTHIFAKLSQNVCLFNMHILMYWHARCNCKLWNAIRFYFDFLGHFIYIDEYACMKYFMFTNFHRLGVSLLYTFWFDIMPNVPVDYGWFAQFFGNFHILLHDWNVITSSNFYILCVKAEV